MLRNSSNGSRGEIQVDNDNCFTNDLSYNIRESPPKDVNDLIDLASHDEAGTSFFANKVKKYVRSEMPSHYNQTTGTLVQLPSKEADILEALRSEKIKLAGSGLFDIMKIIRTPAVEGLSIQSILRFDINKNDTLKSKIERTLASRIKAKDKYIKFNFENRRKVAKNRVEMLKVLNWFRANLLEAEKLNTFYQAKENLKNSFITGQELNKRLDIKERHFIDSYYKKHMIISYAYMELKENIETSCRVKSELLQSIYSELIEMINFQSLFVSDFLKSLENVHQNAIKSILLDHEDALSIKDSDIRIREKIIEEKDLEIELLHRKNEALKFKLGSLFYSIKSTKDDYRLAQEELEASEKEKSIIYSIVKDILDDLGDRDIPVGQVIDNTKDRISEIQKTWEYYDKFKHKLRQSQIQVKTSTKIKYFEQYNLDNMEEFELAMKSENYFPQLADNWVQTDILSPSSLQLKTEDKEVQVDYKAVKKVLEKLQFLEHDESKAHLLAQNPIDYNELMDDKEEDEANNEDEDMVVDEYDEEDLSHKGAQVMHSQESLDQSIISEVDIDEDILQKEKSISRNESESQKEEAKINNRVADKEIINKVGNFLFLLRSKQSQLPQLNATRQIAETNSLIQTPINSLPKRTLSFAIREQSLNNSIDEPTPPSPQKRRRFLESLKEIIPSTSPAQRPFKMLNLLQTVREESLLDEGGDEDYLNIIELITKQYKQVLEENERLRNPSLNDETRSRSRNNRGFDDNDPDYMFPGGKGKRSTKAQMPRLGSDRKGYPSISVLRKAETRLSNQIRVATLLFNQFMDTYVHQESIDLEKIKGSSIQTTIKKINAIYSRFFDMEAKKQVKITQSLYIFTYSYFAEQYSKIEHTNKNYKQLFRSVLKYPQNRRIYLFSQFMGIRDMLDENSFLMFYLFVTYLRTSKKLDIFKKAKSDCLVPAKYVYDMLQNVLGKKEILQSDIDNIKAPIKKLEIQKRIGQYAIYLNFDEAVSVIMNGIAKLRTASEELFLAADINGDGSLEWDEFIRLIRFFEPEFFLKHYFTLYSIFKNYAESEEDGSLAVNQVSFLKLCEDLKICETNAITSYMDMSRRSGFALSLEALQANWAQIKENLQYWITTLGLDNESNLLLQKIERYIKNYQDQFKEKIWINYKLLELEVNRVQIDTKLAELIPVELLQIEEILLQQSLDKSPDQHGVVQIDYLVTENNRLKVNNKVLEKEVQRLKQLNEAHGREEPSIQSIKREKYLLDELKSRDKKIKELEAKIFTFENENSLLKLNKQFQKEALQQLDLADFERKNSTFSDSLKLELRRNPHLEGFIVKPQKDDQNRTLCLPEKDRLLIEDKNRANQHENCYKSEGGNSLYNYTKEGFRVAIEPPEEDSYKSLSEIKGRREPHIFVEIEKKFNNVLRRSMIQIASLINRMLNEEIRKNDGTLEGLDMIYRLEKVRQRLIKTINAKISSSI